MTLIEDRSHRVLDDFVLQGCYAQGPLSPLRLGNIGSLGRLRTIRAPLYSAVQILQPLFQVRLVFLPCKAIPSRSRFPLQRVKAVRQQSDRYLVP
jgi:hypothetical protein